MSNLLTCGYSITSTEVPDEISLCFEISECPHRCKGCHSSFLQTSVGESLTEAYMSNIIDMYKNMITCICFMGGDSNHKEVLNLVRFINKKYKSIKTCMYSGDSDLPDFLIDVLDYYKTGEYMEELGGLNSLNTNQIMYKKTESGFININYKFARNGDYI